ncbi:MAG: N-acetyltransferase family protein [Lapillicoccus sp.]
MTEIRPGEEGDLVSLTTIYNHYVTTSHVTFDDVPFSVDQRRGWFSHYATTGPHRLLVAEDEGVVVGYATSGPFRPKPGYRTTVETTVYVAEDAGGRGVATALYSQLFADLADNDLHRAYAGVAVPNPASRALHLRFGFASVGVFREVGTKFGQYVDVEWFERPL